MTLQRLSLSEPGTADGRVKPPRAPPAHTHTWTEQRQAEGDRAGYPDEDSGQTKLRKINTVSVNEPRFIFHSSKALLYL